MPMMAEAIDEAAGRVADVVSRTPMERNMRLSALTGADVWLKREDLQAVRSYKVRGPDNYSSSDVHHTVRAGA